MKKDKGNVLYIPYQLIKDVLSHCVQKVLLCYSFLFLLKCNLRIRYVNKDIFTEDHTTVYQS